MFYFFKTKKRAAKKLNKKQSKTLHHTMVGQSGDSSSLLSSIFVWKNSARLGVVEVDSSHIDSFRKTCVLEMGLNPKISNPDFWSKTKQNFRGKVRPQWLIPSWSPSKSKRFSEVQKPYLLVLIMVIRRGGEWWMVFLSNFVDTQLVFSKHRLLMNRTKNFVRFMASQWREAKSR